MKDVETKVKSELLEELMAVMDKMMGERFKKPEVNKQAAKETAESMEDSPETVQDDGELEMEVVATGDTAEDLAKRLEKLISKRA